MATQLEMFGNLGKNNTMRVFRIGQKRRGRKKPRKQRRQYRRWKKRN